MELYLQDGEIDLEKLKSGEEMILNFSMYADMYDIKVGDILSFELYDGEDIIKKDFKIHPQSAAFFLWFFHSRSYRFTLYSGLLYPVDVYPNYPTNHSWRRYKVETLLDT